MSVALESFGTRIALLLGKKGRMKMAKRITIKLSEVATQALNSVPDANDLEPGAADPIVVCRSPSGKYWDLIDGFHRAAGMVNWAAGEGVAVNEVEIEAFDVTGANEDLVAAAADAMAPGHEEALEQLLA